MFGELIIGLISTVLFLYVIKSHSFFLHIYLFIYIKPRSSARRPSGTFGAIRKTLARDIAT